MVALREEVNYLKAGGAGARMKLEDMGALALFPFLRLMIICCLFDAN
jgi:hypothetical protein